MRKLLLLVLGLLTTFGTLANVPELVYATPIIISKGGTYTGNYRSLDSNIPCIKINTSEPVLLLDCTLVGAGDLINTSGGADVTVRNCRGFGLTPTVDNRPRGRFLDAYQARQLTIEHNYFEHTAGILVNRWSGNGSPQQTLTVRYNQGLNCDGRYRNGGKEARSFLLLNTVQGLKGIDISYNEFRNEPNESAVEDNINFYNSSGTAASPILVHDNYVDGAYPYPATESWFHGTGLTTDGDGSTPATTAGYIEAYDNQFVSTCNAAMNIAAGHDIHFRNNRLVTDALLPDGTKLKATYAATAVFNYYQKDAATFRNNTVSNNTIGYVKWGYNSPYKDRQDLSAGNCATCTETTHLPNPITPQTEQDEWARWQQKLQQEQAMVGPPRDAAAQPLPVVLTRFEGQYTAGRVLTTWQTAQELRSAYFEVQQSEDGLAFSAKGRVQAAGHSSVARHYSYSLPVSANTPRLFVRLKMVDNDSSVTYSPVVSCVTSSAQLVDARPVAQTLYTLAGRQLWQRPYQEQPLDTRSLVSGIYVLRTHQSDGRASSEKIWVP